MGDRLRSWWRAVRLAATLPLLLALSAFVMFASLLRDVSGVLAEAERVQALASLSRARLAIEAVASRALAVGADRANATLAGVDARVHRVRDGWIAEARQDGQPVQRFAFVGLPGAAPSALGHDRAAVEPEALRAIGGGLRIDDHRFPELDREALARAAGPELLGILRRDPGIALRHFRSGTDRDDWVLTASAGRQVKVAGDLVFVPGNLWLESASTPCVLDLPRDLVLVVAGNVYLGRSLLVRGTGRLLIVAARPTDSVVVADRDASGGYTSSDLLRDAIRFCGPSEGGGSVYLGLPGCSNFVDTDAGLVVEGELHLCAPACVDGPLVLAHGLTSLGRTASLARGGGWTFRPAREAVPGFVTSGAPRPGLLKLLGSSGASCHEPLYEAQPAR